MCRGRARHDRRALGPAAQEAKTVRGVQSACVDCCTIIIGWLTRHQRAGFIPHQVNDVWARFATIDRQLTRINDNSLEFITI